MRRYSIRFASGNSGCSVGGRLGGAAGRCRETEDRTGDLGRADQTGRWSGGESHFRSKSPKLPKRTQGDGRWQLNVGVWRSGKTETRDGYLGIGGI